MKRQIMFLAALALATLVQAAGPAIKHYVNIGNPASMQKFATSDPETFARALQLIHDIERKPIRDAKAWAKTNFGAEELVYFPMLKTSDPAKRQISFVIGGARFAGIYELAQLEAMYRAR
jgi:hypothetical protein